MKMTTNNIKSTWCEPFKINHPMSIYAFVCKETLHVFRRVSCLCRRCHSHPNSFLRRHHRRPEFVQRCEALPCASGLWGRTTSACYRERWELTTVDADVLLLNFYWQDDGKDGRPFRLTVGKLEEGLKRAKQEVTQLSLKHMLNMFLILCRPPKRTHQRRDMGLLSAF